MTERNLPATLAGLRRDIDALKRASVRPSGGGGGTPGPPGPPGLRGTTAQRDAMFPPPTTDAQRAALANQQVRFFNETLGWEQSYYAATGTAGLGVRGLRSGTAAGWYATGASTRLRASLRAPQPITTDFPIFNVSLTLDEKIGPGTVTSGTVRMNEAGRYLLECQATIDGGAFKGAVLVSTDLSGPQFFPSIPFTLRTDETIAPGTSTVVHLSSGDALTLGILLGDIPAGSPFVRGSSGRPSLSFIGLTYLAPLLQGD